MALRNVKSVHAMIAIGFMTACTEPSPPKHPIESAYDVTAQLEYYTFPRPCTSAEFMQAYCSSRVAVDNRAAATGVMHIENAQAKPTPQDADVFHTTARGSFVLRSCVTDPAPAGCPGSAPFEAREYPEGGFVVDGANVVSGRLNGGSLDAPFVDFSSATFAGDRITGRFGWYTGPTSRFAHYTGTFVADRRP